jgi:hypothetical protein
MMQSRIGSGTWSSVQALGGAGGPIMAGELARRQNMLQYYI